MKPKKLPGKADHQRMLDTATAFFLAGERCAPELEFGPYGKHVVSAPRIVSYALAVEIALKLLVRILGGDPRGHSLRELFFEVSPEARIHLNYIDQCIDEIDQYFIHWRYPYEHEFLVGDFSDPRRAFILCYHEIRRQCSDLVSVYERNWGSFEPDWQFAWAEKELADLEADCA